MFVALAQLVDALPCYMTTLQDITLAKAINPILAQPVRALMLNYKSLGRQH